MTKFFILLLVVLFCCAQQPRTPLAQAVSAAFGEIIANGKWKAIYQVYAPNMQASSQCETAKYPEVPTGDLKRVLDKKELVMAINSPPYEPYVYVNLTKGLDVEIAKETVAALSARYKTDIKLTMKPQNFENYFKEASALILGGQVDILNVDMTVTAERAKNVSFTCAIDAQQIRVYRGPRDRNTISITDLNSLNNPNVILAVQKGTTNEAYALEKLKNVKLYIVSSTETDGAVRVIANGTVHAGLFDQVPIEFYDSQFRASRCPNCSLVDNLLLGDINYLAWVTAPLQNSFAPSMVTSPFLFLIVLCMTVLLMW